jgi:hypothetical protein
MRRKGEQGMQLKEILRDIKTKPTVPLWPHAGAAYDLSRGATYQAAHRGEIEVVRIGKSIRAVSAAIRKRLHIEAA